LFWQGSASLTDASDSVAVDRPGAGGRLPADGSSPRRSGPDCVSASQTGSIWTAAQETARASSSATRTSSRSSFGEGQLLPSQGADRRST